MKIIVISYLNKPFDPNILRNAKWPINISCEMISLGVANARLIKECKKDVQLYVITENPRFTPTIIVKDLLPGVRPSVLEKLITTEAVRSIRHQITQLYDTSWVWFDNLNWWWFEYKKGN